MNDFSGPIDKKTAKTLLKLCRKTIPVMTLLDAYTLQSILHGAEPVSYTHLEVYKRQT